MTCSAENALAELFARALLEAGVVRPHAVN
jgi:hypothetical protein